jgi:hypothetical protein
MAEQHAETQGQLTEVLKLQRDANGRMTRAEEMIRVVQRDLDAVKSEDAHIEQAVESIRDQGCNQFGEHQRLLRAGLPEAAVLAAPSVDVLALLTRRQKAVAGAGLLVVLMPAIVEIIKGAIALAQWLATQGRIPP